MVEPKTRSRCVELMDPSNAARPSEHPDRLRCILCKKIYPISKFDSSNSPACRPVSRSDDKVDHGVLDMPYGLCSEHVGRLTRVVYTQPGERNEWVSHLDSMCMHCGNIRSWEPCDCKCDTCLSREVRVYVRYLNNDNECKSFKFWRNTQIQDSIDAQTNKHGQLMAEERCRDLAKSDVAYKINMPIRFEDTDPLSSTTHSPTIEHLMEWIHVV